MRLLWPLRNPSPIGCAPSVAPHRLPHCRTKAKRVRTRRRRCRPGCAPRAATPNARPLLVHTAIPANVRSIIVPGALVGVHTHAGNCATTAGCALLADVAACNAAAVALAKDSTEAMTNTGSFRDTRVARVRPRHDLEPSPSEPTRCLLGSSFHRISCAAHRGPRESAPLLDTACNHRLRLRLASWPA